MTRDNPECPPPPCPDLIIRQQKEIRELETTLNLLVAARFVTEETVKQSRALAKDAVNGGKF